MIRGHEVSITTNASGAGTGYTPHVSGLLHSIRYVKPGSGGYANGVDFDVTGETSGVVLWDQDNVNASATVAPRMATHDTAGAASLYAAGGEPVEDRIPVARERIKIVVANGGDTLIGAFTVYVEE
jgi:hypothetical protein